MAFDPGIALLCLGLPALAAYGAIHAYELPRIAERRQNAKLLAAVKRANTEAAGLRNTIEGVELRLRDARASTAGIDDNLRFKLQKMPARDQAALDALIGQGTFAGLLTVLRMGVMVDRRLAELQRGWSGGASERQCTQTLCENLWVLEPSLVSEGHIYLGKTLGTIAEGYFGARLPTDDLGQAAAKKKPSAVGMFRRRSAVGKRNDPGVQTLLIVEARRPGETVGQAVVGAAIGYAHALRKLSPELADWPVECLIIGGAIGDDAQFAASHGPPGTPIHLATWDALMNQARTRRPETVVLKAVRFDADQPPVYDLRPPGSDLNSFLNIEEEAVELERQDRA